MEITNSKSQISNKRQWSKIKIPNGCRPSFGAFDNWILGFVWDLGFVIWDFCLLTSVICFLAGCEGYSNASLYPEGIRTVYVEMFDNQSFRRGIEYELTDALAKRIEAQMPYKIVTSRNRADTVISGQIVQANESILSTERQIGRALEKNVELHATISWKNLRTGELLIDNKAVSASARFSKWQNQDFAYGSALAANTLAERIVEQMETAW
ncbi:MAG: LptE family protein [Planctomycetota bacterium]